jgi:hypothetical protein
VSIIGLTKREKIAWTNQRREHDAKVIKNIIKNKEKRYQELSIKSFKNI